MSRYRPWHVLAAIIIVVIAAAYLTGRLDTTLYPVGLNLHRCARNGFGATFCGSELDEYEQRVRGVQQRAGQLEREAQQRGREAQERIERAAEQP